MLVKSSHALTSTQKSLLMYASEGMLGTVFTSPQPCSSNCNFLKLSENVSKGVFKTVGFSV